MGVLGGWGGGGGELWGGFGAATLMRPQTRSFYIFDDRLPPYVPHRNQALSLSLSLSLSSQFRSKQYKYKDSS